MEWVVLRRRRNREERPSSMRSRNRLKTVLRSARGHRIEMPSDQAGPFAETTLTGVEQQVQEREGPQNRTRNPFRRIVPDPDKFRTEQVVLERSPRVFCGQLIAKTGHSTVVHTLQRSTSGSSATRQVLTLSSANLRPNPGGAILHRSYHNLDTPVAERHIRLNRVLGVWELRT